MLDGHRRASSTCTSSSRSTCRRCEVEVDLAKAAALRAQARRRAPGGGHADGRRGSRRHLPRTARPTTCMVWSTPETRNSLTEHPRAADRHAQRRPRAPGRRRRRAASCRRPNVDQARERLAPHRRRRQRARAATSARSSTTSRRGSTTSSSRSTTTPSCSASTPSGRRPSSACCSSRSSPRSAIFLLLQASFGSWRLATLAFLTLPVGAGRRRAGGLPAAAASSRSARWSASSRCWASPRATASC